MLQLLSRLYPGDAALLGVVNILAQVTAVVALAALLAPIVGRRGAAARHGLWLAALGCVMLSPALAAVSGLSGLSLAAVPSPWTQPAEPVSAEALPFEQVTVAPTVETPQVPVGTGTALTQTFPPEPTTSGDPSPVPPPAANTPTAVETATPPSADVWHALGGGLFLVWAAGSVVLLARLIHGYRVIAVLRRSARPAPSDSEVCRQLGVALGLAELPPVLTSERVQAPVAGGLLRPWVLIPEGLAESLTPIQLRDVLIHECAHLRRRDPLVGLLQRLAEVLFWPHPLV